MRIFLYTLLFILFIGPLAGCSSDDSQAKKSSAAITPIIFPASAEEIDLAIATLLSEVTMEVARIATIEQPTFSSLIHPLNDLLCRIDSTYSKYEVLSIASPNADIRNAAQSGIQQLQEKTTELYQHQALYLAVETIANSSSVASNRPEMTLLELIRLKFIRNGATLAEAERILFAQTNSHINALCSEFSLSVYQASDQVVLFSDAQLQGIPAEKLEQFEQDTEGNYKMVVNNFNHFTIITSYAVLEQSRKDAYTAYKSVGKEGNPQRLEEIVQLRANNANLLGFVTHADLKLTDRMVTSTDNAIDFLTALSDQLETPLNAELTRLQELKREQTSDPTAIINSWDLSYYTEQLKLENLTPGSEFTPTFTLDNTLQGMFELCEQLFAIQIIEQSVEANEIWQQDVTVFRIEDAISAVPLGVFYLDLFPRENKYAWYATAALDIRNTDVNGHQQLPSAAIIANFTPSSGDQPALINQAEIETVFHEFGHLLHFLLSESHYGQLNSFAVPLDFVEVPSTLLQQAAKDPAVLAALAINVEHINVELFNAQMVDYLSHQNAMSAAEICRILARGLFDLDLHSRFGADDSIDLDHLGTEVMNTYYLPFPVDSAWYAGFTHIVNGYDAGYYSYLWAQAIVADLMSVFNRSENGFYDQHIGLKLRHEIFYQGSSRDVSESVREFLGREWNTDAYMQSIEEL